MKILNILFILIGLSLTQSPEAKLRESIELAIEQKFDEKVVDLVFGVNETEESIYLRIFVTSDKIRFADEKGITLSEIACPKDSKTVFSKEGHFVGIVECSRLLLQKQAFALQEIRFNVFNERGGWLLELKRTREYDYPLPSFHISPKNGSIVLSDGPEGMLYFYDNKGDLRRKVDLFEDDAWNNERNVACCFSSDGNYFVVNALKNYDTPQEEGESYIILFDSSGKEIWRKLLKERISANTEISPSGDYILASGYKVSNKLNIESKSTFLLDKDGKTIYRYPWLFTQAVFSSDGRYLALGEKNRVRLIETGGGEVLWEEEFTKRVRALDISQSGSILIETANGRYESGVFVFYNPIITVIAPSKIKVYKKEFTDSRFFTPYIKILDSGKGFGIGLSDRFLFYKEM